MTNDKRTVGAAPAQSKIEAPERSKLAKKFAKLDPDGRLGLLWTYSRENKRHWYVIRYQHPDEVLQAKFVVLALRAGREIDAEDPLNAWLELVRKNGRNVRVGTSMFFEPGANAETLHDRGEVDHICMVSEILCHRLQASALMPGPPPTKARIKGEGRKPGPTADTESSLVVARIVARLAPDGNWRTKRAAILKAIDKKQVPVPKPWLKNRVLKWEDQMELPLVVKAIEYRLDPKKKERQKEEKERQKAASASRK
jgi:hypothetical protein